LASSRNNAEDNDKLVCSKDELPNLPLHLEKKSEKRDPIRYIQEVIDNTQNRVNKAPHLLLKLPSFILCFVTPLFCKLKLARASIYHQDGASRNK